MLRSELIPSPPSEPEVKRLEEVIAQIVDAFETGASVDELMKTHNQLAKRTDIEAIRYENLYSSMSCREAALEALMPKPAQIPDLSRAELEDIAQRILTPEEEYETSYYLSLFEVNTPSGTSDLFFFPDAEWLKELNIEDPSAAQIVDKALQPPRTFF